MNRPPREKQLAVISALLEGASVRSVERTTGVHRGTILRLLVRVRQHCDAIMAPCKIGLRCLSLRADDNWT